jgi:hypothetical protein
MNNVSFSRSEFEGLFHVKNKLRTEIEQDFVNSIYDHSDCLKKLLLFFNLITSKIMSLNSKTCSLKIIIRLLQHLKINKTQLMEFILKIEERERRYMNKNEWCNLLKFIPEDFDDVTDHFFNLVELISILEKKVRSLERRDNFSHEASFNESDNDRYLETDA